MNTMTAARAAAESGSRAGARKRRSAERHWRWAGFALVAALFALWEVSARWQWVISDSWPSISASLVAGAQAIASGELPIALLSTVMVAGTGFAIGTVAGVVFGYAFSLVPITRSLFSVLVELVRPIPVPAIVPPLVLFLGLGAGMKITVVALTVFFPVFTNTWQGVSNVDSTLLSVGRTFQLTRWQTVWKLIVPANLPFVLSGMRIALPLALIVTVVAEMIAGNQGIGHYLLMMQYAVRPQEMYAAIVLLGVAGYLLNRAFVAFEKRWLFWYGRAATRQPEL